MHEHGSAAAALKALPDLARKAGLENYAACSAERVGIEIRAGAEAQARLIFFGNEDYPKALMTIASPPPVLWITGNSQTLLRPMVAIVGARNASSLGTRMARYLAKGLGELGYVTQRRIKAPLRPVRSRIWLAGLIFSIRQRMPS